MLERRGNRIQVWLARAAGHRGDSQIDNIRSRFACLQDTGGANPLAGQVFTVFIIVVAAAEAAIGLGIVIALYRNRETIWVDEIDLMKW